jgi:GntR family transcriptional regulator, transcriptional repressor for pyruvate dehydrogenase complex
VTEPERKTGAGLTRMQVAPREPLSAEIARHLLAYLFSGEIAPGDRLPSERQLSEMLGVNRPAVREAIKSLGFIGLLEIRQSSGTYFRGADQDLLFRLFEWGLVLGERRVMDLVHARAHLEVLLAGLAAENRTDADLTRLRGILGAMRDSDLEGFAERDVDFHLAIADAADNVVLRDMLRGVRSMVSGWVGRNIAAARSTEMAYADHVPILEAIERQDTEAARAAMLGHMEGATERLLLSIDPADVTNVRPLHGRAGAG